MGLFMIGCHMVLKKNPRNRNPAMQNVFLRQKLREERIKFRRLLDARVEQVNYDMWKKETDDAIAMINKAIRATN